MKLNDYTLGAYEAAAGSSKPKVVKKPIFEKVNTTNATSTTNDAKAANAAAAIMERNGGSDSVTSTLNALMNRKGRGEHKGRKEHIEKPPTKTKGQAEQFKEKGRGRKAPKVLAESKTDESKTADLTQAKIAAETGTWFEKKALDTEDVKAAARGLASGGLVKVPTKGGEKESIYRRVAKFLVIVGVDEAAKILPHLTEQQTERIIPEIASIRKIEPEEAAAILEEFESLVERSREEGGVETARNILTKAYGSQKAEEVLKKSVQFPDGKPFEYLSDADPERIKALIAGESAAVQSLVLSQLDSKRAARVINLMDDESKKNVALRMVKMESVSPEVMKSVDKALRQKLMTQNTESSRTIDGREALTQILKRMDPAAENSIIGSLYAQDPELGADLRKRLFSEDDVIASDNRFIQNYLHDMEDRDIATLIFGKGEAFRQKILSNVSRNRSKTVLYEESLIDKMTKAESEKATAAFFAVLRRAWESGELRVQGRDDGETYV